MSAEATRMQDLASEFSKKILGVIPTDPRSGRGDSLPHSPPARPGLGAERKRPRVGTQTLVPLNFSTVVAPLEHRVHDLSIVVVQ